jgi:hypothetical protein
LSQAAWPRKGGKAQAAALTEVLWGVLSGQALAAFGAACIDHSAATTSFHADQKAVCTCAACFRRLVSAFHFDSFLMTAPKTTWLFLEETADYRKLFRGWQTNAMHEREKIHFSVQIFWL